MVDVYVCVFPRVKDYCIKKRIKWSDSLAKVTCKESEYYEDMMSYLRKNLAVCINDLVIMFCNSGYIFSQRFAFNDHSKAG